MPPSTEPTTAPPPQHVLTELDFAVRRVGEGLEGSAPITPEMYVPGTTCLRTSILAAWTDNVAGLLVVDVVRPRVPVTLELDVHLYALPRDLDWVHVTGRLVKVGRSVIVPTVEIADGHGNPLGFGTASFMVAPDPDLRMPDVAHVEDRIPAGHRLQRPIAERARLEVREPGVVVLPRNDDVLNASNTLNGGLLALAAEEAALSLTPGAVLESMSLHYLQPIRIGPAVATADVRSGLGRIDVRDAGNDDRASVLVTTRTFAQ